MAPLLEESDNGTHFGLSLALPISFLLPFEECALHPIRDLPVDRMPEWMTEKRVQPTESHRGRSAGKKPCLVGTMAGARLLDTVFTASA